MTTTKPEPTLAERIHNLAIVIEDLRNKWKVANVARKTAVAKRAALYARGPASVFEGSKAWWRAELAELDTEIGKLDVELKDIVALGEGCRDVYEMLVDKQADYISDCFE